MDPGPSLKSSVLQSQPSRSAHVIVKICLVIIPPESCLIALAHNMRVFELHQRAASASPQSDGSPSIRAELEHRELPSNPEWHGNNFQPPQSNIVQPPYFFQLIVIRFLHTIEHLTWLNIVAKAHRSRSAQLEHVRTIVLASQSYLAVSYLFLS